MISFHLARRIELSFQLLKAIEESDRERIDLFKQLRELYPPYPLELTEADLKKYLLYKKHQEVMMIDLMDCRDL